MKKQINVVGAVIVRDGEVLCAQRGPGTLEGKWEFPGGKVEPDETPRAALRREIEEELRVHIRVGEQVDTTTHHYEFGAITLTTFLSEIVNGAPVPIEHTAVMWLPPTALHTLDWAPADIPAVAKVPSLLSASAYPA